MPNIPLEGLAPGALSFIDPLTDLMLQALESPRGIALDYPDEHDALSARFKFYHKRKGLVALGNHNFDALIFRVEGKSLLITSQTAPKIREL